MGAQHRERIVDYELRRALNWRMLPNQENAGRHIFRIAAPGMSNGFYISVGETDIPYGRSVHTSAYLTHVVKGVLLAWKRGKLRGSQVRWRCGATSNKFILLNEPTSVICPACTLIRVPRER